VRVHPYISDWLEQVARVALARRREDEIKALLSEGLDLAKAGKKRQAAAILRKVERLQKQ
jgi:hypothetical protein